MEKPLPHLVQLLEGLVAAFPMASLCPPLARTLLPPLVSSLRVRLGWDRFPSQDPHLQGGPAHRKTSQVPGLDVEISGSCIPADRDISWPVCTQISPVAPS